MRTDEDQELIEALVDYAEDVHRGLEILSQYVNENLNNIEGMYYVKGAVMGMRSINDAICRKI